MQGIEATMKRIALLTLALGLFSVSVAAERAGTDGVPLSKAPLTVLPGTLVPIAPPVAPHPAWLMTTALTALPGTPIPVEVPRPPSPRK